MSGIKDQKNIAELRKRLYERDYLSDQNTDRHQLTEASMDVARGWSDVKEVKRMPLPVAPATPDFENNPPNTVAPAPVNSKRRSIRLIAIFASLGIFLIVAIISSIYLFFGTNQISTKNVNISLSAPVSVSAGEVVTLQIGLSNQNTVEIQSANLILNYPSGTKTSDEQARDLFEERIPIQNIAAGEALNVPVSVIMFGEENEEKEIKASIEYRVIDSNGTFFKEAAPIIIKINSSPLVIRATSLEKISSGQELDVKIIVQSNASVVQRNVLVSASFPNSFSFVSSKPDPDYAKNEWLIKEIQPNSSVEILVKGLINGVADERSEIKLSAGTPRSDNQFIMGSILTKADIGYTIERPFIDVTVTINNDSDGNVTVNTGDEASVTMLVKNTLNESIYDMRVEATPKGNLIRDNLLEIDGGLLDSNTNTITWEVSGQSNLEEIRPGEERRFTFTVNPDPNQTTGSFNVSTKVFARRLNETSASEEVVGTAVSEARYSTQVLVRSQLGHSDGLFKDTGPIPPQVDSVTTYTATIEVVGGTNDVSDAVLTTTLPQYITWMDNYDGPGTVEYNPNLKQIKWTIGLLEAKASKQLQMQLSFLPTRSELRRIPNVVGTQSLRGIDRFTEAQIKSEASALSTELSTESGFSLGNGNVVNKE